MLYHLHYVVYNDTEYYTTWMYYIIKNIPPLVYQTRLTSIAGQKLRVGLAPHFW